VKDPGAQIGYFTPVKNQEIKNEEKQNAYFQQSGGGIYSG